jgi:hypothetical protein
MQIDGSIFTKPQWEAIALYVYARKRRRRSLVTACAAAVFCCGSVLITRSLIQAGAELSGALQWTQTVAPIILLFVLCLGAFAFQREVASGRKAMLAAGLTMQFVANFEKYPTSKFL